jgi:transcriptional regulator NrdR family protein
MQGSIFSFSFDDIKANLEAALVREQVPADIIEKIINGGEDVLEQEIQTSEFGIAIMRAKAFALMNVGPLKAIKVEPVNFENA